MRRSRSAIAAMLLAAALTAQMPAVVTAAATAASPSATSTGGGQEGSPAAVDPFLAETIARPAVAAVDIGEGGAAPAVQPSRHGPLTEGTADRIAAAGGDMLRLEFVGGRLPTADEAAAMGATVVQAIDGVALIEVRADRAAALAQTLGTGEVREPVQLHTPRQEIIPPPSGMGPIKSSIADTVVEWKTRGFIGQGVKIGMVDTFDATLLDQEIAAGELPPIPTDHRTCIDNGQPCPFGTPGARGGNALAEGIADMAPGVDFYLAELGSVTDFVPAIDWFAANGVTILEFPSTVPFDGPGDGTGPADWIVDYASTKGMMWFNSAGDAAKWPTDEYIYVGAYWRGVWNDPDYDRWLNFSGTDESLGAYCGALMGLRWSDWGASKTDYDLYVTDLNIATRGNSSTKKLIGNANQALAGAQPLEANDFRWLCNSDPSLGPVYDTNHDGFVSLWVYRTTRTSASPTGDIIELMVQNGWLEYSTVAGSVAVPFADSKNPLEVTVAAELGSEWLPLPSQGPTNDGRAKPDFISGGCLDSLAAGYGTGCSTNGWIGSEAATAFAVGYAAVAASAFDFPTPNHLLRYLRDNTSQHRPVYSATTGPPKSNQSGWGYLQLAGIPRPVEPAVFKPLTPTRVLDTRGAPMGPIGVYEAGALPPDTTLSIPRPNSPEPGTVAYVFNIAVVKATAPGWAAFYPHGWSFPGAVSVLNVSEAGETRANLMVVPLESAYDIYLSAGGHVIVDLVGVFVQSQHNAGRLVTWPSTEPVVDTRTCLGLAECDGTGVAANSFTDITFRGMAPTGDPLLAVPDNATAVMLEVTADTPTNYGWVSVVPGGTSAITVSNINVQAGRSATNAVIVRIDGAANGVARIFSSTATHFQVSVVGYFSGDTGPADPSGMFVSLAPARALDTRLNGGSPVPAGDTRHVALDTSGVPTDAIAALINNVSVKPPAAGTVSVGADGVTPVVALSVGAPGTVVAAAAVGRVVDADVTLSPSMTSHLVTDVYGYFAGPRYEPPPDGALTLLADLGGLTVSDVSISDDGSRIGFVGYDNQATDWRKDRNFYTVDTSAPALVAHPALKGLLHGTLSGDGTKVAVTTPFALAPTDTDFTLDLYRYDLVTETATFEADMPDAVYPYGAAPQISDDGSVILLLTGSPMMAGDDLTTPDLYVVEHGAGAVERVDALGLVVASPSYYMTPPALSGDGQVIAWACRQGGGVGHDSVCYVRRGLDRGALPGPSGAILVNVALDDTGTNVSASCRLQDCAAVLAPLATGTWSTRSADGSGGIVTGAGDLSDDATVQLVHTADPASPMACDQAGCTTVNRTWNGMIPTFPNIQVGFGRLSGDGQWVVLLSNATNLLPAGQNPTQGLYVYHLPT